MKQNYHRQFIEESVRMSLDFIERTLSGELGVMKFKQPDQLQRAIDFSVSDEPCSPEKLLKECQQILEHQVKPYHPHFHNQLFGGFDEYSLVGAMMAPCINGSVYTYEISACWTIMENNLYDKLRQILKWPAIDGIFTPGGSFANFMSIVLARHHAYPESKQKGIYGCKPFKIFTSEVSHYSVKKGVVLCGMGLENIIYVKCDLSGRMIPKELEKAIEKEENQGFKCLMVNATVGTTVEGAIDPIGPIGEICFKKGIWLHVDAAFGGAFLMSPNLVDKMGSFEHVDSITWDPHKALVVPLQATVFLCRHPGKMKTCNEAKADYLFHKERASYDGDLDVGDKSLQCGRVIDILKVWTYLKGNGWKNIAQQVEKQHSLALYVKDYVLSRPERWRLAIQDVDTFNVCFWYIPFGQNWNGDTEQLKWLSKVTVLAKKIMIEKGEILIGYSSSRQSPYFWRTVMSNPFIEKEHVNKQMNLIARYCEQAAKI